MLLEKRNYRYPSVYAAWRPIDHCAFTDETFPGKIWRFGEQIQVSVGEACNVPTARQTDKKVSASPRCSQQLNLLILFKIGVVLPWGSSTAGLKIVNSVSSTWGTELRLD